MHIQNKDTGCEELIVFTDTMMLVLLRLGLITLFIVATAATGTENPRYSIHQSTAFIRSSPPGIERRNSERESNPRNLHHKRPGMSVSLSSSKVEARPKLNFRPPKPEDIPTCLAIETASYPSDEAASKESLEYRQEKATSYFLLCTTSEAATTTQDGSAVSNTENEGSKETILGFVCGTRCSEFTEESMSTMHLPSAPLLAIHSVVIHEDYRRRGIATTMLKTYIDTIVQNNQTSNETSSKLQSIVLLAKKHLLGFYESCGFTLLGPSDIVHGKDLWYELELKLS